MNNMHFHYFYSSIFKCDPLGSAPKTEAVVVTGNTSNTVHILRTEGETTEKGSEHVADVALDNKNRVMFRVKCRDENNCKVFKTTGWFADVSISINFI